MEKKIVVKTLLKSLKESLTSLEQDLYKIENMGISYDKEKSINLIDQISALIKNTIDLEVRAKKALSLKENETIGGNKYREAIRKIIEALAGNGQADKYLIAMKYLESLSAISEGQNNKVVYMPYEATGILSSIDGIKQMLANK